MMEGSWANACGPFTHLALSAHPSGVIFSFLFRTFVSPLAGERAKNIFG